MKGSNITNSSMLQIWNDDIASKYLWNTIILVFILLFGIAGNGLVVLVYIFRMKGYMDDRFFIPVLAIVDLIATIIVCALSIDESVNPVTRNNATSCKLMNYLTYSVSSNSLFLLLIIAIQRYFKICRPYSRQLEIREQIIAAISTTCFAFALFSPLIYFYGIILVNSPKGIIGYICTVLRLEATTQLSYYQKVVFVVYITAIVLMASLYTCVARQIRATNRTIQERNVFPMGQFIPKHDGKKMNGKIKEITYELKEINHKTNNFRGKKDKTVSTHRYSYIFMIITLKAIIAFVGPWVVVYISNDSDEWTDESQNFLILRKMFLFSHVTNPIIYGLFDTKFKRALMSYIKRKDFDGN